MSSLTSDPPFGRGQSLLAGETVEFVPGIGSSYNDQVPFAGREIVGTVKVFTDVDPVTRTTLSNELVYCVAARYRPSSSTTVLNSGNTGADRGKAVVLRMASGLTTPNLLSTAEFSSFATAGDVVAGRRVGFIDEYLTSEIRANDIVWLVIRGPALVAKTTGAAINAGTLLTLQNSNVTTGLAVNTSTLALTTTAGSEVAAMGQAIGNFTESTRLVTLGGNAGTTSGSNQFVRVILSGVNWNT